MRCGIEGPCAQLDQCESQSRKFIQLALCLWPSNFPSMFGVLDSARTLRVAREPSRVNIVGSTGGGAWWHECRVVADGGQGSCFTMCRLLALDSGLGHAASGEFSAVLV